MRIPFQDLTRQYKKLKPYLLDAVQNIMKGGRFILGKEGENFEHLFSAYIGTRLAVGVGSGTDALALGLRAAGIRQGDEVIVPANAYPTAFGVALSGARIRLIDCGNDGNIDVKQLQRVVTRKTKAIVAVHLYGNPADLFNMNRFIYSNNQNILLVEDAAQAHGAEIKLDQLVQLDKLDKSKLWKKVGSIGDIGCFSFYPTKNLGAYGDGGMITTNSEAIASHVRSLRMYGETKRYESQEIAGISRFDELQAVILHVKLSYLDMWNTRRQEIAVCYQKELTGVGDITFLTSDTQNKNVRSVYHMFVIRTRYRNQLQAYLSRYGIETGIHYPVPIHLTKAFSNLGYSKGDFPVAEAMSREILSLPIFPELIDKEIDTIIRMICRFYKTKT